MSIREDVADYINTNFNNPDIYSNKDLLEFADEILELVQKGLEKELTNGSSNNKSTGNSTEVHKVPR